MKTKTLLAILATAALVLGSVQAVQITGDIDFAGQAFFNTTSLATATAVNNFKTMASGPDHTALVTDVSGSFATTIASGDIASFPNVYQFNPSAPASPLWTVGGFSFNLTSSTVLLQTSMFLVIQGTGILTGPAGFDPTPGTWAFSSQQSDGKSKNSFSFSANTSGVPQVPDGGSTVSLLGAALVGAAALRRKLAHH